MVKDFSQLIIDGALQRQERANLANPWVKLLLVVLPLLGGAYQIFQRCSHKPIEQGTVVFLISVLLGIMSAQSIDLRSTNRSRLLAWTLACCLLEAICLLLVMKVIDPETLKRGLISFAPISFLSKLITFSDCLILAFFGVAARGTLLITATDAFTLCALVAWSSKLAAVYETAVTAYFTIRHSARRLFSQASMVAKNRYKLLRHQRSWRSSFQSAAAIYVKVLLTGFGDKAELTESVLNERRWYSRDIRPPAAGWNSEDSVAVVILMLFAGLGVLASKLSL